MGTGPVYFCWHCYGQADSADGPCPHCGRPVAPPEHTDYTTRLIWALHHPLPETRRTAARVLGRRPAAHAAPALRALALNSEDPYLAAAALEALVCIQGTTALHPVLKTLVEEGAAPARRLAEQLLREANENESTWGP